MYYVGIDLGGTNIAAGVVDKDFKIIKKGSVPTKAERAPEEIIADMGALCVDLVKQCGLTLEDIQYAGIASPGTANRDKGMIEYANNLPFLNFPIVEELKKSFPINEIFVENDANAAAKGESVAGAAKGCRHALMITLGTGLGGGIIIDGQVYSGFNFAGAELGHVVIHYGGRSCTCGRKGCWEAYSSATGLIAMTKDKMESDKDTIMHKLAREDGKVSARTAFNAMKQGDEGGKAVVDEYIAYLASGMVSMINIFQPEVFCIGGGVCNEGDYLVKPLLALIEKEQYTRNSENKTQIKVAELGNDAGIIGAAALGQ